MDTILLLQVITVAITLLSLVVTVVTNHVLNNKNNIISTITMQRIKNLDQIHGGMHDLLALLRPAVIDDYRDSYKKADSPSPPFYREKLAYSINQLKSVMPPFYPQEKEVIALMEDAIELAYAYYEQPTEALASGINAMRKELYKKISIYNWALYEFIQNQATGKRYSAEAYDKYYEKTMAKLEDEKTETFSEEDIK